MLGFTQVSSSTIEAMKHEGSVLLVLFKSGDLYKYQDVSSVEYEALLKADSIGSHFSKTIRKSKSYEKLEF